MLAQTNAEIPRGKPVAKADPVRVSESEAEARNMKQPIGGFAPSYNVQLVTEGENGFVVGCSLSSSTNDLRELAPALTMAQICTGQKAEKVVADSGYASRANMEDLAGQGIEWISPWVEFEKRQAGAAIRAGRNPEFAPGKFQVSTDEQTIICQAGAQLAQIGTRMRHALPLLRYQAAPRAGGRASDRDGGDAPLSRADGDTGTQTAVPETKSALRVPEQEDQSRVEAQPVSFARLSRKLRRTYILARRFSFRHRFALMVVDEELAAPRKWVFSRPL